MAQHIDPASTPTNVPPRAPASSNWVYWLIGILLIGGVLYMLVRPAPVNDPDRSARPSTGYEQPTP